MKVRKKDLQCREIGALQDQSDFLALATTLLGTRFFQEESSQLFLFEFNKKLNTRTAVRFEKEPRVSHTEKKLPRI